MDIINGWNDKGMDWDNPQPENILYYQAIYQALYQRYKASNTSLNQITYTFPEPNTICTIDYINNFAEMFRRLIDSEQYVDGDYTDYVLPKEETAEKPFSYSDMPKLLDFSNFTDIEQGAPHMLLGSASRDEIIQALKTLKKNICKLRYTRFKKFGLKIQYHFSGGRHDPPSVREAIDGAYENLLKSQPDYFYPGENIGAVQSNLKIGGWSTHYTTNDDGYCGYVYSYACNIETFFPKDLYPHIYALAYARKLAEEGELESRTNYADYISNSQFNSGSLNLKQGFNKILIGNKQEAQYKCSFGTPYQGKWYPKTPHSYFPEDGDRIRRACCNGCSLALALILDWGVEGGFKFR